MDDRILPYPINVSDLIATSDQIATTKVPSTLTRRRKLEMRSKYTMSTINNGCRFNCPHCRNCSYGRISFCLNDCFPCKKLRKDYEKEAYKQLKEQQANTSEINIISDNSS